MPGAKSGLWPIASRDCFLTRAAYGEHDFRLIATALSALQVAAKDAMVNRCALFKKIGRSKNYEQKSTIFFDSNFFHIQATMSNGLILVRLTMA